MSGFDFKPRDNGNQCAGYQTIRAGVEDEEDAALSVSLSLPRSSRYPLRNSVHVQDGGCSLPPDSSPLSLSRRPPPRDPLAFVLSSLPFNDDDDDDDVARGSRRRRLGVPTV